MHRHIDVIEVFPDDALTDEVGSMSRLYTTGNHVRQNVSATDNNAIRTADNM